MEEKKTLVWLNQDLKKQVDELKEWCDTTYKKAVEKTAEKIFDKLYTWLNLEEIQKRMQPLYAWRDKVKYNIQGEKNND